jgi:hypothetical protein
MAKPPAISTYHSGQIALLRKALEGQRGSG